MVKLFKPYPRVSGWGENNVAGLQQGNSPMTLLTDRDKQSFICYIDANLLRSYSKTV